MPRRPLIVAASLSLLLLAATFVFSVPPLLDPAGGAMPSNVWLSFPPLHLLFAPLFDLWDGVTLLAMPRLKAFLAGATALGVFWSIGGAIVGRRVRWGLAAGRLLVAMMVLALFVFVGIAWRRPMAALAHPTRAIWVVDLHSHTNASHDVKGWLQGDFDLAASRRWHREGLFDAFFVTDHNRIDGWSRDTATEWPQACPGEELSLWGAHIVVLGNRDSIPRELYADSAEGIARIFRESETRWGGITLASIPEYDDNHFADLSQWITEGVDGFEVSNPAPKANRQSQAHRDSVIALARSGDRWIAGVTDQHGMGATVQAWTLVPRSSLTAEPCADILGALRSQGFAATHVVERHHLRVDSAWPMWATVIAVPWEGWRAAGVWQLVSWLTWIWIVALIAWRRARKGEV